MPVNGKAYDWEDVTIMLPNGPQVDCVGIDYSDGMDVEGQYGKGLAPRRYGQGIWKGEGKLTLNREGFDSFMGWCTTTGKSLYKHNPLSISVAYCNDDSGIHIDKLKGVKITKVAHNSKQGDTKNEVELDFVVLWDIVRDGVSAHGE